MVGLTDLKEGDIVCLRSGGPHMVVELTRHDGVVAVTWFDNENKAHRDGFHPQALVRVEL
jgi:uncharacterized protein YodC (DUF2158 family)